MPKKEKVPTSFQMLPAQEIGSFICRFPGSEVIWTCPMMIDGSMDVASNIGPAELDMIDESDAIKVRAAADRLFPPRCFGAQTADNKPDCNGPNPIAVEACYCADIGKGKNFKTVWCDWCREDARLNGYVYTEVK
jgi:hypothetical protein